MDAANKLDDIKSKKTSTGVRWPDEGESKEPLTKTIDNKYDITTIHPRHIQKVTAHKHLPSNKIKPIIKKSKGLPL